MHKHLQSIKHHAGTVARAVTPTKLLRSRVRKRVIAKFAESMGLVYFGFVDQRTDEHRLVRGLTLSATHRDHHYCIGSVDGYDLVLLERSDTIHFPGKPKSPHTWLIVAIDLHTTRDIPHAFLGTKTHTDTFYSQLFTTFASLRKVPLGALGPHHPDFTAHYDVYTAPSHALLIEQLLPPEITQKIGAHFRPLAIEIADQVLYIYADNHHPSSSLLHSMVQNGLWLAAEIDQRARDLP